MRKALITLGAAAIATALVAAGCGSSDNSASDNSGTQTVSQAEFQQKATAYCKQYIADRKPIDEQYKNLNLPKDPSQATPEQLKQLAPVLLQDGDLTAHGIDQLRSIGVPEGQAAARDQVFTALDSAVAKLRESQTAAAAGDAQATAAAQEEAGKEFVKANQAGKQLGGIDACSG